MVSEVEFYLVSTDHFEDRIWFKDDADFSTGMNYVALAANATGVCVIAFVLMSNHVHFVLSGDIAVVDRFVNMFKKLYGMYVRVRFKIENFLRRNDADIKPVDVFDEGLKRAIAYVQMNPVAAKICLHPTQYPWGSGNCFFQKFKPEGTKCSNMSFRTRRTLLRSRLAVKDDWLIGSGGYILPSSYVAVKFVEDLFRTPTSMDYFLRNSSKARAALEKSGSSAYFRDQTLIAAIPDYCAAVFQKESLKELNQNEKTRLVREFKRRFNSDIYQLARVLGLTPEEIAHFLEDFSK
ncbi:MAG: hypothetical protein IKR69_03760 [Bacteroidales bacterium]|nr:hypothetical protein [Bacteroidales bacterium]